MYVGGKMAFYSGEVIEEVKSANDIVDVVSNYVNLKRKGSNYFGLCPFHNERTGSFSVSVDRQIFHCFGCGEGGNVIRFIMKIENLGFKEAIEFLAERAKITLPNDDFYENDMSQAELMKREESKKNLYLINRLAGRFFYQNIEKSSVAQEYIKKRAIDPKTVVRFGLGFSLDDNGLSKFLSSQGFKEEDLLATGLVGRTENGVLYDKFKDRFMFPIFDIMNRVVAFGGRTLLDNETMKARRVPKYINSPENLIYVKGKHLYGLNIARKSNEKMKRILVVEGYMDVITPHQAGISNVVASLGTALTDSQGRLLRKYADEVILSYDSDSAGQKAIMRGLDVMSSLGVTAKVLQMDQAKDPDEYVKKFGPERFENLINHSLSLVDYKVNAIRGEYQLEDVSDKIKFLSKLSQILAQIDSNIERDIYIEKYSRELGVGKEAIVAEIEKILFKKEHKASQEPKMIPLVEVSNVDKSELELENMILSLLAQKNINVYLNISAVFPYQSSMLPTHQSLMKKMYELYETGDINTIDFMSICENDQETSVLSGALVKELPPEDIDRMTMDLVRKIEINHIENEKKKLMKEISNANTEDEKELLWAKMNELIHQMPKK